MKPAPAPTPAPEPSDEALELAWKQGSAPAFAILFERWHRRAYAFAFRRSNGNATLAEDVAQRAFVNLYATPPPGTGRASFKALLFTVVENELRTEARKRGRRKEQGIEVTLEVKASGQVRPDAEAQDREERVRVQAALSELPEEERTVVLLREVEGLSFREVCEATGLTRDMVRGRLAKALSRLRRVLERRAI
jgi:RNA polymerase sigma-70 factor (ECF subfamily)